MVAVTEEECRQSDVKVIAPTRGLRLFDPVDLWRWRELLIAFVVRDIAVRYKQTVIGIAWVVVQPLITVIIFSFLLGKVGNVPTHNLPSEDRNKQQSHNNTTQQLKRSTNQRVGHRHRQSDRWRNG